MVIKMPNGLMLADTSVPKLDGKSDSEKLDSVMNYLYMLLEQLRYTLDNLGRENFNDRDFDGIVKTITAPVLVKIEDAEGNIASVKAAANELSATVGDMHKEFTTVKVKVDGLSIKTREGVTSITGDHVKTGKLVSANGDSEIDLDTGAAKLTGSFTIINPKSDNAKVGELSWDTSGSGKDEDAKNRVWLRTTGDYALKMGSEHQTALTGKKYVYIASDEGFVTINAYGTRWAFKKDGIYCDDKLFLAKPK